MTAETYLERIKKIDAIIESRMHDHKRWVEIADGYGGHRDGDRVSTSRDPQREAHAVIEYVNIEQQIEALRNERQAIIRTVERLPMPEYEILCMIYVQDYTLKEVAYRYGRSYEWAKKKKRKALKMLQGILNRA